MAGILSYFLPKDKVFYSLFEQASDNLEAIAKKLVQVVQEPDFGKRAAYISEMQDIEHQNDNITHQIFIELGKNFITPFDREDIHSLASALDDIADYMYASAKYIYLYKTPLDPSYTEFSLLIYKSCVEIQSAMANLKDFKNGKAISVPGMQYKFLSLIAQYLPRPIVRKLSVVSRG